MKSHTQNRHILVCSMVCYPNVPIDTVRLKFIPFALKDDAKKWMYSLPKNSIPIGWICASLSIKILS